MVVFNKTFLYIYYIVICLLSYLIIEMKRMMKKLDHWNSQISSNDKLVRELQERENDMVAAMDAKDSQLAILKVRLQEADQELRVKHMKIDELSVENER